MWFAFDMQITKIYDHGYWSTFGVSLLTEWESKKRLGDDKDENANSIIARAARPTHQPHSRQPQCLSFRLQELGMCLHEVSELKSTIFLKLHNFKHVRNCLPIRKSKRSQVFAYHDNLKVSWVGCLKLWWFLWENRRDILLICKIQRNRGMHGSWHSLMKQQCWVKVWGGNGDQGVTFFSGNPIRFCSKHIGCVHQCLLKGTGWGNPVLLRGIISPLFNGNLKGKLERICISIA